MRAIAKPFLRKLQVEQARSADIFCRHDCSSEESGYVCSARDDSRLALLQMPANRKSRTKDRSCDALAGSVPIHIPPGPVTVIIVVVGRDIVRKPKLGIHRSKSSGCHDDRVRKRTADGEAI